MPDISVFDVIGPMMVGPSSSHTAGACRIARIAARLFGYDICHVRFTLYGSFAETYRGHGTDRALVGGIMGYKVYDLRMRNSLENAEKLGITYEFVPDSKTEVSHANTIAVHMENDDGSLSMDVTGISLGGGKIQISKINDIEVDFNGDFPTVIVYHKSVPGILAYITTKFSEHQINIASLRCFRTDANDNAIAVIESDHEIEMSILNDISAHENISQTIMLHGALFAHL